MEEKVFTLLASFARGFIEVRYGTNYCTSSTRISKETDKTSRNKRKVTLPEEALKVRVLGVRLREEQERAEAARQQVVAETRQVDC